MLNKDPKQRQFAEAVVENKANLRKGQMYVSSELINDYGDEPDLAVERNKANQSLY